MNSRQSEHISRHFLSNVRGSTWKHNTTSLFETNLSAFKNIEEAEGKLSKKIASETRGSLLASDESGSQEAIEEDFKAEEDPILARLKLPERKRTLLEN